MSEARLMAPRQFAPHWLQGLRVQGRVIGALMVRDALSRYGHDNLGFFWVIGEPLMLTCSIMIIWSVANLTHGSDVGVVPFALTGYSFITLWRHVVFRSVHSIRSNASLGYHRQVSFIDVLVARALLETLSIFSAFVVALFPLELLGLCPPMRDPAILIAGFVLSAWFAFGFGLVLAGLSELSELAEHLIQPFMYVTIPLTGIFFMVEWLSPQYQSLVLWSPLVNGIEMFRSGLFSLDTPTHYSASYLLACASTLNCIGVLLCIKSHERVTAS